MPVISFRLYDGQFVSVNMIILFLVTLEPLMTGQENENYVRKRGS